MEALQPRRSPTMKLLYLLCAAPILLAACAHMASPAAERAEDCRQLTARIDEAHARQTAAEQRAKEAWKSVIPIAVVATYADNTHAAMDAANEAASLQRAREARGC